MTVPQSFNHPLSPLRQQTDNKAHGTFRSKACSKLARWKIVTTVAVLAFIGVAALSFQDEGAKGAPARRLRSTFHVIKKKPSRATYNFGRRLFSTVQGLCPEGDCYDVPLCYDTRLNTGAVIGENQGRKFSDQYLGEIGHEGDPTDYIDYNTIDAAGLGKLVTSEGQEWQSRAFMGAQPSCEAPNAWNDNSANSPFWNFIDTASTQLKNKLLQCNKELWETTTKSVFNVEREVCSSVVGQPAKDAHGQEYDIEMRVYTPPSEGGWKAGWKQGWCDYETASAGKCNTNLPGNVPDGSPTGFTADGGLNTDFSHGLSGDLGGPQLGRHGSRFLRRKHAGEYLNELAVVTDPDHPEEGNTLRVGVYVQNAGTAASPKWTSYSHGGIMTTRLFASGSYEVRAKVPKANGYMWGIWTFNNGVDIFSDRKSVEECGNWDTGRMQPGDEYSCNFCKDPWPTGSSPLFVDQSSGPGLHLGHDDKQIIANEIDIEIPANAIQTSKKVSVWEVPDKYNTMNINGYRWTNDNGMGTFSNMFVLSNKDFYGDGEYHNYRFDWHTGGTTRDGKHVEARVDFYMDGDYIGTNDLMVPVAASRFWIMFRPHGSAEPGGTGFWNGLIGYWRDPATGQVHYNRNANGEQFPETPAGGLQQYTEFHISRITITPFFETNDRFLPSPLDQPDMNRLVECGYSGHLSCGTDPVVPLRTSNHFHSDSNGPAAPCCGAVCMSNAAASTAGAAAGSGTTDSGGDCPVLANTVPYGGLSDRPGGCNCGKGEEDARGDITWGPDEYDDTCHWYPDKFEEPTAEYQCTNKLMDLQRSKNNPWTDNFGCRYDAFDVCFPLDLPESEVDAYCAQWPVDNCGEVYDGTYWDTYRVGGTNKCVVRLRPKWGYTAIHYDTYTGLTSSDAPAHTLPEGEYYQGCRIDYHANPPAHDGTGSGLQGCEWFVNSYCPGSQLSDFEGAISEEPDVNGNQVCQLQRYVPINDDKPGENEWPGFRSGCDVDYSHFPVFCTSSSECDSWKGDHCDHPESLTSACVNNMCEYTGVAAGVAPVRECYETNPEPPVFMHGCDWNYLKYPPCAIGSGTNEWQNCEAWVEEHCENPETFYFEVNYAEDRNGNVRCMIWSEWETKVGGKKAACSAKSCEDLGPAPTPGPSKSPSVTPSKFSSPSPTPSKSLSRSPTATPSPSKSPIPSKSASPEPSLDPSSSPEPAASPSSDPSPSPEAADPSPAAASPSSQAVNPSPDSSAETYDVTLTLILSSTESDESLGSLLTGFFTDMYSSSGEGVTVDVSISGAGSGRRLETKVATVTLGFASEETASNQASIISEQENSMMSDMNAYMSSVS